MKNKNALGKASLVLAFIAVAYYIVINKYHRLYCCIFCK